MGLLHAYINTAEPGSWPTWALDQLAVQDAEGEAIDVGQFAAPQLIDVNADELADLVIGEKNGTLSLYINCGTPAAPAWCLQTTPDLEANWGGIQVNNALGINGYSTPCLYTDGADLHIAAGNELGEIQYFGILNPADILAPLEATGPSWNESMRGLRSSGTLGDVNGDGIPELVVGIQNGGLRWFNGTTVDITGFELPDAPFVVPNPASAGEWIRIALSQPSHMAWMVVQGRLVQPLGLQQAGTASLAVPITPGLYLLTTQPAAGGIIRTVRVVVQ